MLENLLINYSSEEIGLIEPGSSILLSGTAERGFYGEISSSNFITGEELASAIGLISGTLVNNDINWLKFAYQNKTLFVPKNSIRANVLWSAIYQAGAVYGDDTFGLHPAGSNRLQNARVTFLDFTFKVRLLSGGNTDPNSHSTATQATNSEWNKLIFGILTSWSGDLASYDDLFAAPMWCKEKADIDAQDRRVARWGDYRTSLARAIVTSAGYGWYPVLELIP